MAKMSVLEFFDGYSRDFNAIYGSKDTPFNRVIDRLFRKSMRLRYAKSLEGCELSEGGSVLDIGCGPGHYSVALASKGATRVLGIDFAHAMIELAQKNAKRAGVERKCEFVTADFMTYPFRETFDYSIVMGFMDYVRDARPMVERVLSLTRSQAFFSFPAAGGFLAWQRRLRYRSRCDLFLYNRDQIESLLRELGCGRAKVQRISRDFFVSVSRD
jgi:2-polyprenyl-3-methyl-5-hydroxy-6-metoxy-1,4-benzoquinol methylase